MLLGGCAVGPDFHAPPAPAASGYSKAAEPQTTARADAPGGGAQRLVMDRDIPAEWWSLFHSEPLDALISDALKANPDLAAAQAALRLAIENMKAEQGAFYPQLAGSFDASRNKNSQTLAPVLASNVLLFDLYQAQLAASWTPDLWGGTRRSVEALRAEADAQRFQLEATYLALTANLVAAAVQEASLRAQVAETGNIIKIDEDELTILKRELSLGQVSDIDVAAQDAALAQVRATLPPLQKQLAQQRDLLTALAGRLPSEEISQTFALDQLGLPDQLPLSLPSKLVEQRPDIRMAEENLHAANAEVGVAIANMLPNITLSANNGSAATVVGQLLTPGTGFWSLGAGIAQPIFDGGALLHKTRAARAALDQASAQYRSTVVTAFQNVADVLHAIQSDADGLSAAVAAEKDADRTLALTRKQVAVGQVAFLVQLNAEQAFRQAHLVVVQARAQRLTDTAALFQALGGGWWNRNLPDAKEAGVRLADVKDP
jgi:NodT family efflux transporter outer membrane factor (OMF) lipoprotein